MLSALLSAVFFATPANEVRAAAADVERLPRHVQPGVRYLTLYNIDPPRRTEALQVVNYTLNSLSRARTIGHVTPVSPTLVRFSIGQYAPQPDDYAAWFAAWEKLAEFDPYFHLRTEIAAGGPLAQPLTIEVSRRFGASPVHSSFPIPHSAFPTRTVTTDGGWTDLAAAARLRAATHSAGALLRADYFVAIASVPPRYYEFAGIAETENDFVKSLGLDRALVDRLRANAGANVIISGVTGKPRRIVWSQGPLGGVYATLDVERVDAARDPLRRPVSAGGLNFRFDASEWFAVAPNGLWRTAIFNAAGQRQDAVPDRVAKDTSDPHGDGIIVPMLSCIRCHREAGLRPFADDQTRLLAGRVDLFSDDAKIVQRAAEFYDEPRLQRQMRFDRETYAAAVARATALEFAVVARSPDRATAVVARSPDRATRPDRRSPASVATSGASGDLRSDPGAGSGDPRTTGGSGDPRTTVGLKPDELADNLAAFVRNYAYLPIAPDGAAREVGLSPADFRAALSATQDPIILTLLEGRGVLRGQWDSSFAEAALVAVAHGTAETQRRGEEEKE